MPKDLIKNKDRSEEKKDDADAIIHAPKSPQQPSKPIIPMLPPTVSPLKEEALWALKKAKAESMIGPDDTSAIFHSLNTHRKYLTHLTAAFESHPQSLHAIAIKTNPHPAILKQVVEWGFGLESASMEEVQLAIQAGCPYRKIVFDSPVKTKREIKLCHDTMPGMLVNANSLEELKRMPNVPNFVLGLRINPMVDTGAPGMFHVSSNESKFGVPLKEHDAILNAIVKYPITALHLHSGTAMSNLDSAVGAIKSIVALAKEANKLLKIVGARANDSGTGGGHSRCIDTIDNGGGLRPEILNNSNMSRMEYYASALRKQCPDLWQDFKLVTEFGQWSYFYSGYAYSEIEYAIQRDRTRIVYVHLGANFFLRDVYTNKCRALEFVPMNMSTEFRIKPMVIDMIDIDNDNIIDNDFRPLARTDIAGPLCFAGDYIQKSVMMPRLEEEDGLLMLNVGSNAFGLWSRHCSRTIPMLIGVDEEQQTLTCMSQRFNPFLAM